MAADPLVPVKTPFNYNLGINYETWVNGRTGRSITADLNAITKDFGLIKTFHDVGNPGGANPVIDPDQLQVIKYVARSQDLQLVMGTYTSALAKGGYGSAWSAGSMTSSAYTDKWVKMIVKAFGSTKAVKDHLPMIVLGNEIDQLDNHPSNVTQYMGWFRSAFDNLSASLKKAGLGSIPVTTTIAAYTRTDAGSTVAVGATKYIYQNWKSTWNGGDPIVLFNDYTPSNEHGQFASTDFKPVINYYKALYKKLGNDLAPFVGETGYSSFYTQANQVRVYNQIKSWLNGQYNNNGGKTIPLFAFDAFDQPSKGGLEQQFGIYADNNANHRPTGLKTNLTLPAWSRGHIRATATDDRLYGTSGNDVMSSLAGADVLYGQGGVDNLQGGEGDDRLNGGTGADVMAGGAGNDRYFVDNAGDQVIEAAGEGIDKVYAKVDYTLAAGQSVEILYADAGTTGLALTGNELRNTLKGGPGDDVLKGGAGGDKLDGGAGDDRLDGGSWSDTMAGGTGNDAYFVDNAGDRVIEAAGEGTDKVYTQVDYTLAVGQAIEFLRADAGTTGLMLIGNEFRNTIEGGEGDDRLYGGGGGDKLRGGAGDDFLDGGRWSDTLTGGSGADTFAFASAFAGGSNVDTVADFAPGTDTIQLDRTWFAGLSLGQLAAAQFATGAATGSGPQIVYNTTTGALFFDSNGSAAGGRAQFAQLSPGLALTANDFSVV